MSASALPVPRPRAAEVARLWALHLLSFVIPGIGISFLLTGPHPWYVSILFVLPLVAIVIADRRLGDERRQPVAYQPAWPFDLLVYVLAALQLWTVYLIGHMYAQQSLFSMDLFMAMVVVGTSSGFSIITAHELIHRPVWWERLLGRALLVTVLYEHFYTEHIRGHHVRIGTAQDGATARYGETFRQFYRRTVPQQFRSAWRLECTRLGDAQMRLFDARQRNNRVLHGVLAGALLATSMGYFFGATAFVAFVFQAQAASRLLEVVNYFEHWGLVRTTTRVRSVDSWDTHSWFTYYALVGLSRHADHHAYASRAYQDLRVWDDAPVLPRGYVSLIPMVLANDQKFHRLATEELQRRKLGPFAEGAAPAAAARSEEEPSERSATAPSADGHVGAP
jgi:alkane 1-monooxygenase